MHRGFLGDSYDLVKRFWAESLRSIAPLYTHPDFVPEDLRGRFTKVTRIPIFNPSSVLQCRLGLLLDPDTGIPLPDSKRGNKTMKHAPLEWIAETFKKQCPEYLIC